jgi:hypothetical protein
MQITQLPYVDEHTTDIAADVEDVWPSLTETLDRDFGRAWAATYARLVGCADRASSGPRPLVEGSTIPGFHVVAVVPGQEIVLEGRHHFSSYALTFRLERIEIRAGHGYVPRPAQRFQVFMGPYTGSSSSAHAAMSLPCGVSSLSFVAGRSGAQAAEAQGEERPEGAIARVRPAVPSARC